MSEMEIVREWFEIAQTDLKATDHLYNTMHPRPLEIICYHCQQAAEKSLKGFITSRMIEPPFTHDLEKLRLICVEHNVLFDTIQLSCLQLTGYSATTRYPNSPEIISTDAALALIEAKKIHTFCSGLFPSLQTIKQEDDQAS